MTKRLAIATLDSHIYSAIQLQKQLNTGYLVFGKPSPWDNDENPPNEVENTKAIDEIIGYKKLKQYSLSRPIKSEDGTQYPTVTYGGQLWELVPVDKAYELGARWVYISAEILPEDFALGEYRQVGVHTGLKPIQGVNKPNLLPSEVEDPGILLCYENREPQNRTSSVYVLEQFVIEV